VKSKHANDRKRLDRFVRSGYVIDFACSVSEGSILSHLLLLRFPHQTIVSLDISASHRHSVRVVELSEAFRFCYPSVVGVETITALAWHLTFLNPILRRVAPS
jgi:hypothetical protein